MSIDYAELYPSFKYDRPKDGVLRITFDAPGLNAVDIDAHREIGEIWLTIDKDPDVQVAILQGAGKGFSAGGSFDLIDGMINDYAMRTKVMREARETPGVKKLFVASGIRMDLARRSPKYMRDLTRHHVGGHLKVAPEHTDHGVLARMRKPGTDDFEKFARTFNAESKKAGKKQYIVPYFIASHPGSDIDAMIDLAVFLKRNGYRPDQVQDFIPAPFDVATAMYYTGIDPFTKKKVFAARNLRDRKLQRALMQFFKPENYVEGRKALLEAGRGDLIGEGCDALIPSRPPREAIRRRRREADEEKKKRSRKQSRHDAESGYRPGRKSTR